MKNIAIISIIIFIVLSSCEKEFKIKIKDAGKKIVVNTVFNNDSIIKAEITRSFSPYGKIEVKELLGAEAKLFEDGIFIENLTYSKEENEYLGNYKSTIIPKIGKKYEIQITENELGKVKASSTITPNIDVNSVSVNKITWGEDNINSYRYNYSFTLEDNKNTNDFYYITMAIPVLKKNEANEEYTFYAYQYAEILTASLPEQQPYLKNGILFKDDAFNGVDFQIYGTATTYAHPSGDYLDLSEWYEDGNYKLDTTQLYISLHHLSKELYDFYLSHSIKLQNEDDVYSEPTPIYSNVENGFGIFGGENITLMKVNIEY